MKSKIIYAVAVAGLVSLCGQAVHAAPMRCSDEQKTCVAACNRTLDRSSIATCITNCSTRQSVCVHTGCWDNGVKRYCNMMRQ